MDRDLPRPAMLAALALVAGMVLARGLALQGAGPGLILLLAAAALLRLARPWRTVTPLAFLLLFVSLGFALQGRSAAAFASSRALLTDAGIANGDSVQVVGRMGTEPRWGSRSVTLLLLPGSSITCRGRRVLLPAPAALRVHRDTAVGMLEGVLHGDTISARGRVALLSDRAVPGDFDSALSAYGCPLVIRAYAARGEPPREPGFWSRYRRWAGVLSRDVGGLLATVDSGSTSALLEAMVLGRTDKLPPGQLAAYQATGLVHIFSVSGLHAGFACTLIVLLGSLLGLGPGPRAVFIAGGLLLFATLTGLHSPVVRASLLAMAVTMQPVLGRRMEPLSALAAVLALLVTWDPRVLWQLDFQLSFTCALVLVLMGPVTARIDSMLGPRVGWGWTGGTVVWVVKTLVVSIALQLALAPMLLGTFGQFSLVAPLANVLVLPVVGVLMTMVFVALLLAPFSTGLAGALLQAAQPLATLMDGLTAGLAQVPRASVTGDAWPVPVMALYYLLLLSPRWLRLRRVATPMEGFGSAILHALAALAFVLGAGFIRPADPLLTVRFLDVGQGDCTLLRTRDGAVLVVDAGPPGAAHGLVQRLRRAGVRRIDHLVATHADADHIGGAAYLLREFEVGEVLVGGSLSESGVFKELAAEVALDRTPVVRLKRGAMLALGREGVEAKVLHPTDAFAAGASDRNDASVVLMVSAAGKRVLLTGDAEEPAEVDMVVEFGRELQADVLKAGHHGSASSSSEEFLDLVRPSYAIISCGAGNRYHHPSPKTLERLRAANALWLRTDVSGTITLEIDRGRFAFRTER